MATSVIAPAESKNKTVYIESYGCQMNFSDSEIVASILTEKGFQPINNEENADLVLLNTCSIRDNAEVKIRSRLMHLKKNKKHNPNLMVGVLGCMAERLKSKLLEEEKLVDIVAGPDAYRNLPELIEEVEAGQKAVNVLLSREETYAELSPVRLGSNGMSAFISIMRGCDNMCSFCVVPFTRGRERSREPQSILNEAIDLYNNGYREITLLGQNVDSYRWNQTKKGEIIDPSKPVVNFAGLMELVAKDLPELRIRFSTSHPKDLTADVAHVMAKYENICNYIHLPVQSGNSEILKKMNRGYSREWYFDRIKTIKSIIPDVGLSTDIITGFCSETEDQHKDTLSLMQEIEFDFAYMFKYSERPNTLAERKFEDDVSEEVKTKRLTEIIDLQMGHSLISNKKDVGKTFKVLVEGTSKKSDKQVFGRNSQNKVIVFDGDKNLKGTYVNVAVKSCTAATLIGEQA